MNRQAMQERRGAPFAARTDAFLFARACKRRDAPRAFARILGRGGNELAGPGGGQQKQRHSFAVPRGAGATFARAKRAAPPEMPAANGVTAHGRGNVQTEANEPNDEGGRAAAAPLFADGPRLFVQPALQKR